MIGQPWIIPELISTVDGRHCNGGPSAVGDGSNTVARWIIPATGLPPERHSLRRQTGLRSRKKKRADLAELRLDLEKPGRADVPVCKEPEAATDGVEYPTVPRTVRGGGKN